MRALQLEWALSKDEILSLYLTLAPYGGNLEGVRAASLAYFGKEPRRLTLGEAALLVALPQSPEFRRPDRFPAAAKRARDRVLDRIAGRGLYSASRDRARQARAGADRAEAHAADRAACGRRGVTALRRRSASCGSRSMAACRKTLEKLARERAQTLGA